VKRSETKRNETKEKQKKKRKYARSYIWKRIEGKTALIYFHFEVKRKIRKQNEVK
jgi:hypothetical protein